MVQHVDNPYGEEPNTIWGWRKSPYTGEWEFQKVIVDRAVAGDTDSIMMDIGGIFPPEQKTSDVVEISDGIGEVINSEFPEFCCHAFGCSSEMGRLIATKREIVSDTSFFLTKKRYVMHVVDDEGSSVNKLKIVGVELKKSDTSEGTKILLKTLVDLILAGTPRSEVLERVDDMRHEFNNMSIQDISVPLSTKTLEKVKFIYKKTGQFRGCHYGAKAAWWWNNMKTEKEKEVFAGEKIGLVYVKHADFAQIGYPIDMKKLPEWFLDIPVDYDKMWSKTKKKLTNYLKAMKWDVESRREDSRSGLFGV